MDNFRSPKVVKLEQQNEALLAQVEELRENLEDSHNEIMSFSNTIFARHRWINASKKLLAKAPQQSLDSLKARIEEETIEICKEQLKPVQSGMLWRTSISKLLDDLPRKYPGDKQCQ